MSTYEIIDVIFKSMMFIIALVTVIVHLVKNISNKK